MVTVLSSFGLLALAFASLPAGAATTCDFVVAANGSDTAAGTVQAPFETPDRLAQALAPGQTGCVRGTVQGDINIRTAGVTVTSEPGQRGKIIGRMVVHPDATGATVSDLDLNGRHTPVKPGPVVLANDAVISGNDITNDHTSICMIIGAQGHDSGALAERVRIEGNRIHDCGELPSTNQHHGIYAEHTLDLRIVGNEIYDNADRGVQLYPNAQRSYVAGNIIDNNGEGVIFSGASGLASSDNLVVGNVISNSNIRNAIESYYPAGNPVGQNNVARDNCLSGPRLVSNSTVGFTASDNLEADPGYVNRATRDYTLRFDSPCAGLLEAARAGSPIPTPIAPLKPTVTAQPTPRTTARIVDLGEQRKLAVQVTPAVKGGNTVAVTMKVVGTKKKVDTKLAFRFGARRWQRVGTKRVSKGRKTVIRLRAPHGTRKLTLRARTERRAAAASFKLA